MNTRPIRVLLAVGSTCLLEALQRLLAHDQAIIPVAHAVNGETAIGAVLRVAPDVAVLDFHLPDCNPLLATRRIKAHRPETRVILLSDVGGEEYERAACEAGASACLVDTEIAALVETIKGVSRVQPAGQVGAV